MANMMDYLDWRGDLSFEVSPFNEVDNLILSTLAYTDLDGIVPGLGSLSISLDISRVNECYWKAHTREEIEARTTFYKNAPFLMDKMAKSKRFSGLRLLAYVNRINEKLDQQMSAVTCLVGDGTTYIAFRGTDDTLTGWKEDFDFSYMHATAGQSLAAEYLNKVAAACPGQLRVGGHSKGGNFAVYASAYCNLDVQERIMNVYSNDGPGFMDSVIETPQMQRIVPRIIKFTPAFSMIGILLSDSVEAQVIASSEQGVMQHDGFSWQVLGTELVRETDREKGSLLLEKALAVWIEGESPENKKHFIDVLFGLMQAGGANTLDALSRNKKETFANIVKIMKEMPKESREAFFTTLKNLGKSGNDVIQEGLEEEKGKLLDRIKDKFYEVNKEKRLAEKPDQPPVDPGSPLI